MYFYKDLNGYNVTLSFVPNTFSIPAKHVLILANNEENQWLVTKHPDRGIEFPGGKVEESETLEEAAKRETYEETGAVLTDVTWFAEYKVDTVPPFRKVVFRATVQHLEKMNVHFETDGYKWVTLSEFNREKNLSFHMKDKGMKKMLERVMLSETKR
ncbi:MAG: NUDIX domain-containing protein [Paenisporosarcina sp.]